MQILGPCAVYVEGSSAAVKFLGPKLCAFQVLIAVPLSSKMVTSAYTLTINGASQVALLVKNPATNVGDIRDLGSIPESGEAPGEEGLATHSSILAWTEEPGRLGSTALQRIRNYRSDLTCMQQCIKVLPSSFSGQ